MQLLYNKMFHNSYQSGVISILSAYGSNPLQLWDITLDQSTEEDSTVSTGRVCRITSSSSINNDDDNVNKVSGSAIEISGQELSKNYITCPPTQSTNLSHRPSLGIKLPYLNLTIHVPSQSDFSIEVTILDDKQKICRFRASTYQSTTVIKPDICTFPLKLERQHAHLVRDALLLEEPSQKKQKTKSCWNNVCIPLDEYTKLAYGSIYQETVSIQIHSHCYLKRVYFSEKQMNEDDELPEEFRLYTCPSS